MRVIERDVNESGQSTVLVESSSGKLFVGTERRANIWSWRVMLTSRYPTAREIVSLNRAIQHTR